MFKFIQWRIFKEKNKIHQQKKTNKLCNSLQILRKKYDVAQFLRFYNGRFNLIRYNLF